MNTRCSQLIVSAGLIVVLALALVPLADAQEGLLPNKVELTPYEGNPVLEKGEVGEWDSGYVFGGAVVYHDGLFHMFYSGSDDFFADRTDIPSIGYATSEDGFTWTKYTGNPVLTADKQVTPGGIGFACPVIDGDTWILFLAPRATLGVRESILKATAPAPTGPWTVEPEPIAQTGDLSDWDTYGTALMSAQRTDTEYVVTYFSRDGYGRVASADGVTWAKYNDPATTETRFANSDPIFGKGEPGAWDSGEVLPTVYFGERGWEMFYFGNMPASNYFRELGYAVSPDGVHWTRFGDNPVLKLGEKYINAVPDTVVVVDGTYFLFHSIWYGDQTPYDVGIAVTTGTITG